MQRVNLQRGDGDLAAIERAFVAANPGHSLAWLPSVGDLPAAPVARIALVQGGSSTVHVERVGGLEPPRESTVGDVIVLAAGEAARFDPPVSALVFGLPEAPAAEVPRVIRPDWDPRITDTPGGCATDAGAYRRVLLTWLGKNGPYTFRGLNVHRVRIDDSFTHYHPRQGGFDEFYLVQAVRDGARILTSSRTADIERPETIARHDVATLFESTPLLVGDLVYLPRGTAHRGLGGVVAQVITVPGFVPGAEVGLDHHLRAINERLGLLGAEALPLHAAGVAQPIVR
ncbi:MAG: hypothetical protein Q7T30_00040 [Planctomycetota bacterium]|nr:hypothetical protein [Planctomycetota bacterium]